MQNVQLQTICKIIDSGDFNIITKNNVTEEQFFLYPTEFKFIRDHFEQYKKVPDKLTFLTAFPNFLDTISEWPTVNESDDYLLTNLFEVSGGRALAINVNKLSDLIKQGNLEEAFTVANHLTDGIQKGSESKVLNLFSNRDRLDKFIHKTKDTSLNSRYYRTGFPTLDRYIGGIDPESENMVICARTGVGKTWALLEMAATAVAQGLTVGFYSGEMTPDKIGYRLDTIIGGIDNIGLMRALSNRVSVTDYTYYFDNFDKVLNDFMMNRYNCPAKPGGSLKILYKGDITGAVTVDTLRGFVEKEDLDILFVDQYSLLDDTARSKARAEHERIANITRGIKALQVEKGIPIISVSQQNRSEVSADGADAKNVAGSDAIAQYATVLLMLDQKEFDGKKNQDGFSYKKWSIFIAKSRDGGDKTTLTYLIDFNSGDIINFDDFDNMSQSLAEFSENLS